MEDAALVRQTLAGDSRAFGALVSRYQGTVYGYACHYLRDYAEAQDLAQDAFVEAYRRAQGHQHQYRGRPTGSSGFRLKTTGSSPAPFSSNSPSARQRK